MGEGCEGVLGRCRSIGGVEVLERWVFINSYFMSVINIYFCTGVINQQTSAG